MTFAGVVAWVAFCRLIELKIYAARELNAICAPATPELFGEMHRVALELESDAQWRTRRVREAGRLARTAGPFSTYQDSHPLRAELRALSSREIPESEPVHILHDQSAIAVLKTTEETDAP